MEEQKIHPSIKEPTIPLFKTVSSETVLIEFSLCCKFGKFEQNNYWFKSLFNFFHFDRKKALVG